MYALGLRRVVKIGLLVAAMSAPVAAQEPLPAPSEVEASGEGWTLTRSADISLLSMRGWLSG